MTLDLQMNASNFEVFNAKRTKESLVYGKLTSTSIPESKEEWMHW